MGASERAAVRWGSALSVVAGLWGLGAVAWAYDWRIVLVRECDRLRRHGGRVHAKPAVGGRGGRAARLQTPYGKGWVDLDHAQVAALLRWFEELQALRTKRLDEADRATWGE